MAQKYEEVWHKFYYELPRWKQTRVIEDPNGRVAQELAHEVAAFAEKTFDKEKTLDKTAEKKK